MLPQDPLILLSVVNTKLRDGGGDLDELCAAEDVDRAELEAKLASLNYRYNAVKNQFVPKA